MATCLGKKLFIRLSVHVFCIRLLISVYASFPIGFEGGMYNRYWSNPKI